MDQLPIARVIVRSFTHCMQAVIPATLCNAATGGGGGGGEGNTLENWADGSIR